MGFYQDLVEGLKGMIGQGRKYANPTQMAKACGVAPNQIIRYIKQERGKHIQVVAKVLDEVGAKIIFPGNKDAGTENDFFVIPRALARPDFKNEGLLRDDKNGSNIYFSRNWLTGKGSIESMHLLTVTGNSMSPRIEDGDQVIVDESQKELNEGRIYAIRIDREIVVRRIAKEPGKTVLISDCPDACPKRIELEIKEESLSWATIGRIIYVAKDLL
ncbi:S24 family peptidase [Maridesulfovibrio hydrothermalis]|uniref:Putative phage repressor n=1 Tax=Maridesulfovibrio hydrothermalis AM13 = DSM 14728 TaxID=1121451 RepID=L0RA66_9BACT|nr:S24 family peptidase [Maridesulfovibrio hydrothermalis]CCO23678.1 putative phage repressor [Maridesulfovibrio hydrothermalis AM13 = DSM 14728]